MFWFLLSILLIYFILLYFNLEQRRNRANDYRYKIMAVFRKELQKTIDVAYRSINSTNPLDAMRYGNYAIAYLDGLRIYMKHFQISKDNIVLVLGFDMDELESRISGIQKRAMDRMKTAVI